MRILLLKPPVSDPTLPSLSIPVLAASCRAQGHDTAIYDLAIEAFDDLTEPEFVRRSLERIGHSLSCGGRNSCIGRDYQSEAGLAYALGQHVLENIDNAKQTLRSDQFYDYRAYKSAIEVLRNSWAIHSAAFFPTIVDFGDYQISGRNTSESIRRHIENAGENVFLDYFRERAVPKVLDLAPQVVGVSITYRCQLIPGLSMVTELKKLAPDLPIVLGGAFLTSLGSRLAGLVDLLDAVTAVVMFEGETALLKLLDCLDRGDAIDGIPNVVLPSRIRRGRIPEAPEHVEPMPSIPMPDFKGTPLHRYLVPEVVLPVQTCRACYWGKCNFCGVSRATAGSFRKMPEERLLKGIDDLFSETGCRHFFVCDDATPPATLRAIAAHVTSRKKPYRWCTEVRFEKSLTIDFCRMLHDGGCAHLLFGFESAVPRVLQLMDKGTNPELISSVLEACRYSEIAVNLQCFLGFPGETVEEAKATGRFLRENRSLYTSVAMGHYKAVTGSAVFRDPAKFGISFCEPDSGRDMEVETWREFVAEQGISTREAKALSDRILGDLTGDDLVGPGFLFGSSSAHGLLYCSRHGRTAVDSMGVDPVRWCWNIGREPFYASRNVKVVRFGSGRHLLMDSATGHFVEVDLLGLHAFEICRQAPVSLPAAVSLVLGDSEIEGSLDSIATTMAALIRMARLGILVPVSSVPGAGASSGKKTKGTGGARKRLNKIT